MGYVKQVPGGTSAPHNCRDTIPTRAWNDQRAPLGDGPDTIWRCDDCGSYWLVGFSGSWCSHTPWLGARFRYWFNTRYPKPT